MTCWHKIYDAPFLVSAESCEAQIRFIEALAEFLVFQTPCSVFRGIQFGHGSRAKIILFHENNLIAVIHNKFLLVLSRKK